ncbi:hypothetical protein ACP4OV_017835 [Aristida adscensionis]
MAYLRRSASGKITNFSLVCSSVNAPAPAPPPSQPAAPPSRPTSARRRPSLALPSPSRKLPAKQ